MNKNKMILPALLSCFCVIGMAQETKDTIELGKTQKFEDEVVQIGYHKTQKLKETTSSVSTVYNEDFNKRSAKNIGNSLYGYGTGLTTLQGTGRYADYEPTFYIRGLQSLSTNTPLIIVDGIERDITNITPEEVESVTILKDASAVALYGNKGINGVMVISTKRGKYNAREINFNYDHGFEWQARKPKFVNSFTYANAMNEALNNDGNGPRYSSDELKALQSGNYPYLYPNVDWQKETLRNVGATDIYNISFRGGAQKFRYYALGSLTTNKGFIGSPYMNEGYSTQDHYSKANLRTNLDIDLTEKTKLKLNVLGVLSESKTPGSDGSQAGAYIWDMLYTVPSLAFPVQLEDGTWGGNSTWEGTQNPVAQSQASAYTKYHERALFADMTLSQDLSSITPGLGASALFSYDNTALYWEDHSKTYIYGSDAVNEWVDGVPSGLTHYQNGAESAMGSTAKVIDFTRVFNFAATIFYDKAFNEQNKLYAQLKWDYEYRNKKGTDNTWYRQNASLYAHYANQDKYFVDLSLVASASNKLAPGHKWSFSPTVAAAWLMTNEDFLKENSWIDFLKLRASFGIIHTDRLPLDGTTEQTNYWEQTYGGGSYYPFDTNYSVGTSSWSLGRLASLNSTHEKAYKYNLGFDATLFHGLNVNFDAYYERRSDIWVSSTGKYSSVLGFTAPFENGGVVDSKGIELGLDYTKKMGDVTFNVGANFTYAKNEIKEQLEEPRLYDNLITTGNALKSTYGLQALGFFKDEADIANSPTQLFGTVKPGDIKYKDVNGDNKIDANDKVRLGYSTTAPEIYYSFHLGAEYKGLGFDAQFQGTGNYSAVLNTTSMYWPLINNSNISEEYYNNRWTTDNQDAKYPRLSSQSNANNNQTNTVWLADRSFLKLRSVEVYYKLPGKWMAKSFIKNARIYARGIDLLCFDNIKVSDPECYGASYPLTRSAVVGLSVGF